MSQKIVNVMEADKIIYMMNGDIKEVGSHEELMRKGGCYAAQYAENKG